MSEEAEEVKKLLAFKKKIEKRVEKLESELKELKSILEAVNSVLLSKGFKRPEIVKAPATPVEAVIGKEEIIQPPVQMPEFKEIIPLKTTAGESLAKIHVGEGILKIVLAEDKTFNIHTPPFNQFFVERVLAKMQQKDGELAKAGKLKPEETFTYTIFRQGDIIREIHIKNFDAERLKEIKSSVKWTLEKMYEKMKSQS